MTRAIREQVEAQAAKHVGKHKTDRDEMNDSKPKMVDARARARATICRMRTYVKYFVIAVGMSNMVTPSRSLGSNNQP